MPRILEYHIMYIDNDFEVLLPSEWRVAKKIAEESRKGIHPEVDMVSIAEFIYSVDRDDDSEWYLEKINYTDLYVSDKGENA